MRGSSARRCPARSSTGWVVSKTTASPGSSPSTSRTKSCGVPPGAPRAVASIPGGGGAPRPGTARRSARARGSTAGAGRRPRPDAHVERRPRVAPVVHRVVDEPRVPARRDPLPGGVEVRLVRDGVLEVREPVARVREQLDQRDPEVRRVALDRVRVELRHEAEQQRPEARVVLGEVVEREPRLAGRQTLAVHAAVDVARAAGRERERRPPEHGVERRPSRARACTASSRRRGRQATTSVPSSARATETTRMPTTRTPPMQLDASAAPRRAASPSGGSGFRKCTTSRQPVGGVELDEVDAVQRRVGDGRPRAAAARRRRAGGADLGAVALIRLRPARRTPRRGGRPSTAAGRRRSRRAAPRPARPSTASTSTTSSSQRWSDARTSICVVVASTSLSGANTIVFRPQPKSGRLTRSPGSVNSTCSIRSRTWSSAVVAAVRPSAPTRNGKSRRRVTTGARRRRRSRSSSPGTPLTTNDACCSRRCSQTPCAIAAKSMRRSRVSGECRRRAGGLPLFGSSGSSPARSPPPSSRAKAADRRVPALPSPPGFSAVGTSSFDDVLQREQRRGGAATAGGAASA